MDTKGNEADLARRARNGDREALSDLVERSRLRLFALAYAELRHYEDAQDAVAAALVQICLHVGKLREPERVGAWMAMIVRHEARRLRRRAAAPLGVAIEEATVEGWERLSGATAAGAAADHAALRLDVQRALRRLPREEARAVALFYLSGRPIREIAVEVGRPEGTIKRWLHLGRRRLANHLEVYAPMTPTSEPRSAAIISTDIEPSLQQQLVDALKQAGWEDVATVGTEPVVTGAAVSDAGETEGELQLAPALRGKRYVILDEWIGGRSAFELHTLLRAHPDAKAMAFGLLLHAPAARSTVFAAWSAGFDLCLTQPVDPAEFGKLSRRVLEGSCP